jgi:hypothetical protein
MKHWWPAKIILKCKQPKELQQKKAVDWFVSRYADAKEEASTANETNLVQIRVSDGVLKGLIKKATIFFKLTSDFDVPKTTIHCRIKSGILEVWQPGQQSMLLNIEVILKAYLFTVSSLNCHSVLPNQLHRKQSY